MADDAPNDIRPGFNRITMLIFERVPERDDLLSVKAKRRDLAAGGRRGSIAIAISITILLDRKAGGLGNCAHLLKVSSK